AVARAGFDFVINFDPLGAFARLAKLDAYVEIAAGLEIVAQVSSAFGQQIRVYGVFLKNRNVAFQHAAGDLCAPGLNVYDRTRIDADDGYGAPPVIFRFHAVEHDGGKQPVRGLVAESNIVYAVPSAVLRHIPISGQEKPAPAGRCRDLFCSQSRGVPLNHGIRILRPPTAIDHKSDVYLVCAIAIIEPVGNRRTEVTVIYQEGPNSLLGRSQRALVEPLAKIEPRSAHDLARTGRVREISLSGDVANKPCWLSDESQCDTAVCGFGVDFDIPIATSRVEALDSCADFNAAIRLARANRENGVNLVGSKRLALRVERDVRDDAAFELRGCRELRATGARGDQRQCSQ